MKIPINLFVFVSISLVTLLLSGMDGCDTEDGGSVAFVQATPTDGSTIPPDATIIATFDGTPTGLDVTGGKFSLSGSNVTIVGPFTPGPLALVLTWANGAEVLTYTVDPGAGKATGGNQAAAEITTQVDGRTMVLIPGGEFEMGSEDGDADPDEQPVHTVHVDAFYMDTHEVTNLDYKKFVLANPQWQKDRIPRSLHNGDYLDHWTGNSYPRGKVNHPVVYVSWYAAVAYSKWAGKRLPTEAEWEKAARGGKSGLKYPWGNTIGAGKANYDRNVGDTREVGSYSANGGLHDMVGNVWEWCLDAYDENFYFSSPPRNPLSDVNTLSNVDLIMDDYTNVKSSRVLRGGSWLSAARFVRVADRFGNSPSYASNYGGFRCARTVTP